MRKYLLLLLLIMGAIVPVNTVKAEDDLYFSGSEGYFTINFNVDGKTVDTYQVNISDIDTSKPYNKEYSGGALFGNDFKYNISKTDGHISHFKAATAGASEKVPTSDTTETTIVNTVTEDEVGKTCYGKPNPDKKEVLVCNGLFQFKLDDIEGLSLESITREGYSSSENNINDWWLNVCTEPIWSKSYRQEIEGFTECFDDLNNARCIRLYNGLFTFATWLNGQIPTCPGLYLMVDLEHNAIQTHSSITFNFKSCGSVILDTNGGVLNFPAPTIGNVWYDELNAYIDGIDEHKYSSFIHEPKQSRFGSDNVWYYDRYRITKNKINNLQSKISVNNFLPTNHKYILQNPGYKFDGFYVGDKKVTTLDECNDGDVVKMKWIPNTYNVVYKYEFNGKEVGTDNLYCIHNDKNPTTKITGEEMPLYLPYIYNKAYDMNIRVSNIEVQSFKKKNNSDSSVFSSYSYNSDQFDNIKLNKVVASALDGNDEEDIIVTFTLYQYNDNNVKSIDERFNGWLKESDMNKVESEKSELEQPVEETGNKEQTDDDILTPKTDDKTEINPTADTKQSDNNTSDKTTDIQTKTTDNNNIVNNTEEKDEKITLSEVSKVTAKNKKGKKISLKWAKVSGATKYEIQISTKKSMKKAKTYTTKKTTYTIKKLKKNKVYYVRIRAISNDIKGSWSKVTKVKIKK